MAVEEIGLAAVMDMANFNRGQKQYSQAVKRMSGETVQTATQATKSFRKVGDSVADMAKKSARRLKDTEDAFRKIGQGISGFAKTIGKSLLVGTAAIAGVGAAAMKLAVDASEIPGVAASFASLGGSIERMREGALGMVTDVELMKSFNTAASLVSKDFAQKLPDAMQYLSKVSAATGQDMGFMIDSLVKGVGRMSPMILDNLGIQVALSDATAEASKMFGVQASELSKAQQQAGMMNVVLAKLQENTKTMPEVVGTAAQQWASLQTTLKNLKNDIGVALIPALQKVLEPVMQLATKAGPMLQEWAMNASEAFIRLFDSVQRTFNSPDFRDGLNRFVDIIRNVISFLSDLDPMTIKIAGSALALALALPKVVTAVTTLSTAIKGLNLLMAANPIGIAVAAIVLAGIGIAAVTQKIKENQQAIAEVTETTEQKIAKSAQTYDEYVAVMVGFLRVQERVPPGMSDTVAAMHALDDGLIQTRQSWELMTGHISEAGEEIMSAGLKTRVFADEFLVDMGLVQEAIIQTGAAVSDELQASIVSASTFFDEMSAKAEESSEGINAALKKGFSSEAVGAELQKVFAVTESHEQALVALEESSQADRREKRFSFELQRQKDTESFQQEYEALITAGRAEDAAKLQTSFDAKRGVASRNYTIEEQLQKRANLIKLIAQKRAYLEELKNQHDQVLRVLAVESQKAMNAAGIAIEEQKVMIGIIYQGGSEQLKNEHIFAEKSLEISQLLAAGEIETAQSRIEALAAIQKAQQGQAEAALGDLKGVLRDFKIDLPPLPPLDVSALAGAGPSVSSAASKATEPATAKLRDVVKSINDGIDLAMDAIAKLTDFELPAGVEEGFKQLNDFLLTVFGQLHETAGQLDKETSKIYKRIAKSVSKIIDSFVRVSDLGLAGQLETAPDVGKIQAWAAGFEALVRAIIDATQRVLDDLGSGRRGYENIKLLQKVTRKMQKMLEATVIDFEKLSVQDLPDMQVWKEQMVDVTWQVFQMVQDVRKKIKDREIVEAAEKVDLIKKLIELTVVDLSAIKRAEIPNMALWKTDFTKAAMAAIDAVQDIAGKTGAFRLTRAAQLGAQIKSLLELVVVDLSKIALVELPDLTLWRTQFVKVVDELLTGLKEVAEGLDAEGLAATVVLAEALGKIIAIVEPAMSALTSLAAWEPLAAGIGIGFVADLQALLTDLTTLEVADVESWTEDFSSTVGRILSTLTAGITALAKLLDYPSTVISPDLIAKFRSDLAAVLSALADLPTMFLEPSPTGEDPIQTLEAWGEDFATAADRIFKTISSGVGALAKLLAYVPGVLTTEQIEAFQTDLVAVLTTLAHLPELFIHPSRAGGDPIHALESWGEDFASAADKVFKTISSGVGALGKLLEYVPGVLTPERIQAFQVDLVAMLMALAHLPEAFLKPSRATGETFSILASWTEEFATTAGRLLDTVKKGIDAIAALTEYESDKDLVTKVAQFRLDLEAVLRDLGSLPASFAEGLGMSEEFAANVNAIVGIVKPAIDAIVAMLEYEGGDVVAAIAVFKADMETMLGPEGLPSVTGYMLANVSVARAFKAAASEITDALNAGLAMFTGLASTETGGYLVDLKVWAQTVMHWIGQVEDRMGQQLSAMTTDIWDFRYQLGGAVRAMGEEFQRLIDWFDLLDTHKPEWLLPSSPVPLAEGLKKVRQELVLLNQAAQPVYASPQTTTNQFHLDFSGTQINNGMDMALFEARVLQTVHNAMNRR